MADIYLNDYLEIPDVDEDIINILSFVKIIPLLLHILINLLNVTKDTSRENDAYKLIRYCADFRFVNEKP